MDSDESGHDENEFYYPDEEDYNEIQQQNESGEDEHFSKIQEFIYSLRPDNTNKKTTYDLNVWRRYCYSLGEERDLENIPPGELNILLCRFFMDVRKKDGEVYEPVTLTSFQRSIQRYLNDRNSTVNILKDQQFSKCREVLSARKRDLVVNNAKGNRPQAARELTEAEEDLLFKTGQFGEHEPEVLQRTVWWVLSLQFGFRARDESRKLQWGDVGLENDPLTGKQVLVWKAERGSKTRHGDGHSKAFNPKAHATGNERCPVHLYLKFAGHRPEEMKKPESPFFLAIKRKRKPEDKIWFMRSALGKNKIGEFLAKAARNAGLAGNLTNHSVRKTCISRLMDADVPENYVAQLSGHKNLKSLDSYKTASDDHQRKMSLTLSRTNTSVMPSSSSSAKEDTKKDKQPAAVGEDVLSSGLFSGSTVLKGCTFNFNFSARPGSSGESFQSVLPKRKRHVLLSDDSDSD